MQRHPQEGQFHFNLAVLLQDQNNLKEAEQPFVKAATLAKDSAHVQGWVGRFFLKVKADDARALQYYLNAYFRDPHFYDSEHAEARIRKLNREAARTEFARLVKGGRGLPEVLRHENPVVAGMAVSAMAAEWKPAYSKALLEALGHDDGNIRWQATAALVKHLDRSFDPELQNLLKSSDLRKRGLAAYLAVRLWGREGMAAIQPWLKEEAQLLRFDAVSALLQQGGAEGRRMVLEHRPHEKHPLLIKMLDSLDKR